jgi:predicted esterase
MEYLPAVEIEYPKGEPVNAAIIWLHGLGAMAMTLRPSCRN